MHEQAGLGQRKEYRAPSYTQNKIGRVTSTKDYAKYGRIEVVFLDYGKPFPVWVMGHIDREPVDGDTVVVGWLDGRKDAPYLQGFVKNESYTTNFITMAKDKIRIQLPIFDIGIKGGVSAKDVEGNLLDDSNLPKRAYVELDGTQALVSFPTSKDGSTPPATITLTADRIEVFHPKETKLRTNVPGYSDAYFLVNGSGLVARHPTGTLTVQKLQDMPSPQPQTVTI